jgi:hypothetical protein
MALPSSGVIKFSNINTELGLSSTSQRALGQATTRSLYGVASGAIRLAADGYGKANQFTFSIASPQSNLNLRSAALSAGWPGTAKVVATVNSGVYVYGTSTSSPGLTVDGSWPGGVSLINNGSILGQGGNGGGAQGGGGSYPGAGGGLALSVSAPVSITNNGTIGGGGGGGGGGGQLTCDSDYFWGGGGGGGGQTGLNNSSGGPGGGSFAQRSRDSTPGGAGTVSGAGDGGQSAASPNGSGSGNYGGSGGGWGSSGNGGNGPGAYSGGSGGAATSGSGSYITWVTTGTRYGTIG